MIISWLKQKMKTFLKFRIDERDIISIFCDKHLLKIDFISILPTGGKTLLWVLQFWNHEFILITISNDVWLLYNSWSSFDSSIWTLPHIISTMWSWCSLTPNEHLIPNTIWPSTNLRVSCKPLLLRSRTNLIGNKRISHETTTCVACSWIRWVILKELELSLNMQSSQRRSLRYGPKHWSSCSWLHMDIFSTSPEISECPRHSKIPILNHEITKICINWSSSETMNSCIEPNFNVNILMITCFEQKSIPWIAPLSMEWGLMATLLGKNCINCVLNVSLTRRKNFYSTCIPIRWIRFDSWDHRSQKWYFW